MANIGQSDNRFQDRARGGSVLEAYPGADALWRWLHPWRWPAGLLAGMVLWLALVAVAGAATPIERRGANHPFVINNCFLQTARMPTSFGGTLQMYSKALVDSRSSLPPRP